MMPFFSIQYMLFMLPALILAGVASILVRTTFSKYSKFRSVSGMTGAQAAALLMRSAGVNDVKIEQSSGFLSDHYDPTSRTLRLSPDVYDSSSLSAIGVACHEAGHALQHATHYMPLAMRSAAVPVTQFGSTFSYILLMIGGLLGSFALLKLGVILFTTTVIFAIITLPVEWDASARAKRLMVSTGIVSSDEARDAAKVLNAAFLTYVASAVTALLTLLYYLLKLGVLGGRDER